MNPEIGVYATVTALRAALLERRVSAVELLEAHLRRIARINPALNAIVAVDEAAARARAREADALLARGCPLGTLHGVPITIKDNIDVAGWSTTHGLVERAAAVAPASAPAARRLLAAGTVLLGKTNLSTNAGDWQAENPLFGRTNNPWDPARTPGGSTGGGAAALAAGLTALELGTDIGGSIRVPAAFCGLYGHRPSDGLVPRRTTPNPAIVLNVQGPLARSADDLELALAAIIGPDLGEDAAWRLHLSPPRHRTLAGFRVAVLPYADWLPVDAQIRGALDDLAGHLRRVGARVEVASPDGWDLVEHERLYASLLAVMECAGLGDEERRAFVETARRSSNRFGEAQALGAAATAAQYLRMIDERERYRSAYRAFFERWDILLTPVEPVVAFPHIPETVPLHARTLPVDQGTMHYEQLSVYPGVATLSGQPATAFPWGRTREGLPIGLQAIGPYLEDLTTLRFAGLLEAAFGGFTPPPGYRE